MDIREISNYVLEISEGYSLIGPTGHSYAVTKETFRNVFKKQTLFSFSYEFAILARWLVVLSVLGFVVSGSVVCCYWFGCLCFVVCCYWFCC